MFLDADEACKDLQELHGKLAKAGKRKAIRETARLAYLHLSCSHHYGGATANERLRKAYKLAEEFENYKPEED